MATPSGKKGVAYTQNKKVKVGDMGHQLKLLLEDYTEEVQEAIRYAVPKIAKEAKDKTIANAKSFGWKDYPQGWAVKRTNGVNFVSATVHNKTDYRLTHLLEHGHAVKNGTGRIGEGKKHFVDGRVHIKPVEEWANAEMERILKQLL